MGLVETKLREYLKNNKGGITWRLKKHCKVVEKHLNPGEEVLFVFAGQKNDNPLDICLTSVIALTNKRILVGHKTLLWNYSLKSITPELYNDLTVYNGLFWGKIKIDTVKEVLTISNLAKSGLDDIETEITQFMMDYKKNEKDNKSKK